MDSSYPICGYHYEDMLHILRDCIAAKDVWNQAFICNLSSQFFSLNLQDCILSNVQDNSVVLVGDTMWACLFGIIIWRPWKNRNLFNFQDKSWSSSEIIKASCCWASHCSSTHKDFLRNGV